MATDPTPAQLDAYYKLNLQHLKWSFASSLGALICGLVALLAGVAMVVSGNTGMAASLVVVGGVLTEFIGAGFFFLYGRNIQQLNVFYDKLIKHQDTMYAISLANALPEPNKSNSLQAVVGSLLSRGEPPFPAEVLKAFAPQQPASKP